MDKTLYRVSQEQILYIVSRGQIKLQGVSWIEYSTGCLMDSLLYRVSQEQITPQGVSWIVYSTRCLMDSLLYRVSYGQFTLQGVSSISYTTKYIKDRLHYRVSQEQNTLKGCLIDSLLYRVSPAQVTPYTTGCLNISQGQITLQGVSTFLNDRLLYRVSQLSTFFKDRLLSRVLFFIIINNTFFIFLSCCRLQVKRMQYLKKRHSPVKRSMLFESILL